MSAGPHASAHVVTPPAEREGAGPCAAGCTAHGVPDGMAGGLAAHVPAAGMRIELYSVGATVRLDPNTRITIHRRQGLRICLGITAPSGTPLVFDGASIRPLSGTAGSSNFLFSLHTIRRFVLGQYDVRVWLPGELVLQAADCHDWLHIGIALLPPPPTQLGPPHASAISLSPASAATAQRPLSQSPGGGGRPLSGGA
jgi:hypothetical protein